MKEHALRLYHKGKNTAKEKSFRRYLFVGFSTVALDYTVLFFLRSVLGSRLVIAVTAAYWTSIVYNFLMNRYYSFEANDVMIPKQMVSYGILLLFNYAVTLGMVSGLKALGLSEYIAKLFAIGLTLCWTYIFYKKFVFATD